jgi:hypothetical protein
LPSAADPPLNSNPACIAFRSLSASRFLGSAHRLGAGGVGELYSLGAMTTTDYSEFEMACLDLRNEIPKLRSRHCFNSAIIHLRKAKDLLDIDHEMSAFRAITAEEEASSGLMYCLKEIGYDNADKLNPKDHSFKYAVIVFLDAVKRHFAYMQEQHGFEITLVLDEDSSPKRLRIKINNDAIHHGLSFYPEPPLHFVSAIGATPRSFQAEVKNLETLLSTDNIVKYIKDVANFRNKILYASEKGYPRIVRPNYKLLEVKRSRVITLYMIYLLIWPYREKQLFVQQCIDSLLAMLNKIPFGALHPEA